jgi:hypothetical protein
MNSPVVTAPRRASQSAKRLDVHDKDRRVSVSLGIASANTITGDTTPEQIVSDIQSGRWANEIAALRSATNGDGDRLKKKLPAVLWSGQFTKRTNAGIKEYSGLICADLDKIPERLKELHGIARNDQHVVAAFVSPSGTGFKIVFRVPADAQVHAHSFAAVRAHVASKYGAKVDEAAKDIARLCFVSHDPEAFWNPDALPLPPHSSALLHSASLHTLHHYNSATLHNKDDACNTATLHNKAGAVLANITAKVEAQRALAAMHPNLVRLYADLIEPRFQAKAHARNDFIVQAVPFLYRCVAPGFILALVGCFYDCNRILFNDPREQHLKEAKAMLESVTKTYTESLNADERSIYDALSGHEQEAFAAAFFSVSLVFPKETFLYAAQASSNLALCQNRMNWRTSKTSISNLGTSLALKSKMKSLGRLDSIFRRSNSM